MKAMAMLIRLGKKKQYYVLYSYGGEWYLYNNRRGPVSKEEAKKIALGCHAKGARTIITKEIKR